MSPDEPAQLHLALHCRFLRGAVRVDHSLERGSVCVHPIRDGEDCVGPFLEDLATRCGLWEQDAVGQMAAGRRAATRPGSRASGMGNKVTGRSRTWR